MLRRLHSLLLLALLVGSAGINYVQAEVYEGTCGAAGNEANVTWELDTETGTLAIRGTGAMTHYWSLQDIPWFNYRQYITRISVYYGVTALGHHAFYDCSNVTEISLCNSLTSIGVLSFAFCRKLTTLEIPVNVASIGDQALWYNESLKEVHVEWTGDAVPAMPSNIHNFEASQIRLHIPCGQTAAYVAKGWNTKFALVEGLYVGTIETTTDYFPWVLNCDSIWKVSGTGALKDFPNPSYTVAAGFRVTVNIFRLSPVFGKSEKVKEAIFEEGITYIGNNTFYKGTYHSGYPYLTTLTLPSTLTSMSSTAFKGCIALRDVYVSWTTAAAIPAWNQSIDVSQATLHVPCGTKSLYQAKSGWQNFIIREEPYRGTCGAQGDNLTWNLCDGTLTISGSGAMVHYWAYEDIPWWNYRGSIQRIVIEEGVTTIGNHAFVHCSNLTSVSLPNTLTAISVLAFGHCTGLPTLVIPSSVTSMAGMFIHNTPSLTDVYVSWTGDAVPDMPADIHPHDASQKRLHIPCGQETAYTAKGWNTKFTYVTTSSGTCGTNVQWTLDHCTGVLTISGTGAMTDYSNESEVPWRWLRESITSVIIQNGVTRIGDNAFYNCANITSMTVPPSITSFGMDAFFSSWAMESLYITDLTAWCNISFSSYTSSPFYRNGRTEITHGGNCYVNGTQVTTLTIPNGITEIPNHTFSGFANITSIQFNQATSIGGFAFAGCHGLTHVTIPEGVTTIGNNAFAYCTNLESISVPASVTSLGTDVLYNSLALTDIYVHWTENIPSWGSFTSKNPQSDITLHVPCGTAALYQAAEGWQDYTIVEDKAHGTCGANGDNLTWTLSCDGTLTIRGTGEMYNWMSLADRPWHSLCTSIQRVVIEEGVTTTGFHAFYGASNLTSVSLPSTLQTLQFMTFFGCGKLTTLTIPSSVTSVGNRSLEGCAALTDVYMSETGDAVPTMPPGIHTYDASRIKLHIPCGQTAAYTAKGWNTKFTIDGVVSGTCGDNVQWTFESCNGTLTISGTGAMKNYPNPVYHTVAGISIVTNRSSLSPFWGMMGEIKEAVIEEGITYIGNNTFYRDQSWTGYNDLTTLTLPSTLTRMSSTAFKGCVALKDVYVSWTTAATIPTWNQTIDVSQTTLHVPCGTAALYQAAEGWQDYTIVEDDRAHGTCGADGDNLTWNLCDGTLTIQGTGAMKDYTHTNNLPWVSHRDAITTIIIEEGVTTIGDRAFGYSTNATSVTIPSSVTSIGDYAFIGCSSLQEITIPNTINALGIYMLYACSSLTDIYASWISEIPAWPTNFTNNSPQSSVTLHVPCEVLENYQAAEGWKDYHIEGEGGPYTITVESDDPTMGTVDAVKIGE